MLRNLMTLTLFLTLNNLYADDLPNASKAKSDTNNQAFKITSSNIKAAIAQGKTEVAFQVSWSQETLEYIHKQLSLQGYKTQISPAKNTLPIFGPFSKTYQEGIYTILITWDQ